MNRAASVVQKGGNIKPAILSDSSIQYNPLDGCEHDDPKLIEEMVRNIAQLDQAGHEQIYIALRKTKPKSFFAINNVDTHFNIYGLTPYERRELRRIIQLSIEDMDRKSILSNARKMHQDGIAKLDEQFDTSFDDAWVDPVNPSEADKIKEMLQMNM